MRFRLRYLLGVAIVLWGMIALEARAASVTFGSHQVPADVARAIERAARATGVDLGFLMSQAAQESGFRADARAGTSSATGLYQFIDSTWLQMLRDYGARHGYGHIAQQIQGEPGSAAYIGDPELRRRLLDLRYDPLLSSLLAAEYAQMNRAHIERSTGRSVRSTDLYLGHFLGTQGAARFMVNLHANPNASAADLFPSAAGANQGVFYDRGSGFALSLQQVYERFAARFEGRATEFRQTFASNVRVQNGVTIIAGPPRNGVEMIRFNTGSVQVLRPQSGGIGGGFFMAAAASSLSTPAQAVTTAGSGPARVVQAATTTTVVAAGQIGGGRLYTIHRR